MRHFFFCLALLGTSSLQAVMPASQTQEASLQNSQFTNNDKRYTITLPAKWKWQSDFMGLDLFAAAPVAEEQKEMAANISVVSGPIEESVNLETFFSVNVENLKKLLRDVKVVETGKAFLDNVEGRKIVYTHAIGDILLQVVQYFAVKNGYGYIITCSASADQFSKYTGSFDVAVRSFKIIKE